MCRNFDHSRLRLRPDLRPDLGPDPPPRVDASHQNNPRVYTGRWERRHHVAPREDLANAPKYTDERHGFLNRWQARAGFGDGGRGVAEWTAENLANMSLMHSGRWQRRSGARLATEFMPARAYAGYGRNRGDFVPVDPKDSSHAGEGDGGGTGEKRGL